ncbi:CUB and sushi domain-containing protein 3-like [Sycon ciliatum]|uniref:CUB and sushi domain-containing protein 3-like n=1 Tax=Sycon ciliatum TaxID=27933 RepID=UPI0031F6EEDA
MRHECFRRGAWFRDVLRVYCARTSITYSCNTGYQLSGATTTVCQTSGTWSGAPPTCTRVLCSSQVAPSNGAIASVSLEVYGAAIFTCNSGYNVVGSSASVCLPNGTWSISPPTCQRVQCPSIVPSPSFGSVLSGSNAVFNSRKYECHPGYQLEGIKCPTTVASPNYGNVTTGTNDVFSSRKYICNAGYQLQGSSHTICLSTGEWSGPTPTCKRVLCSSQVAPIYGSVDTASLEINGATIFTCYSGYYVVGSSVSVCLPNGTWSNSPPICQRVVCSHQNPPPNGAIASVSLEINGATIFTCSSGYKLLGSSASVCLPNGTWSNTPPTCVSTSTQCPANPPPPFNGIVSPGGRNAFTTRTYSCNTGYQLSGATTTICQTTGAWSGTPPTCRRVVCSSQHAPSNGAIASMSVEIYGATIFTCSSGYTLVGSSASVCLRNGAWSTSPPICQRIQCPMTVPAPTDGNVTSGTNDVFISRQYTCNDGYKLQGSSHTICLSTGAWSGPTPTCKRITCSASLVNPTNGRVTAPANTAFSVSTYSCTPGYELVGHANTICLTSGQWSGQVPTCSKIACSSTPTAPTNGSLSPGGNDFLTVRTYSCNPGFQLIGDSTTVCQANRQWSDATTTCTGMSELPASNTCY